ALLLERFCFRHDSAVSRSHFQEESVRHTRKNCFGNPFVLTRRGMKESQFLFGSYNEASKQRDLTARCLDLAPPPDLKANKARPQCHSDEEHRYRCHPW